MIEKRNYGSRTAVVACLGALLAACAVPADGVYEPYGDSYAYDPGPPAYYRWYGYAAPYGGWYCCSGPGPWARPVPPTVYLPAGHRHPHTAHGGYWGSRHDGGGGDRAMHYDRHDGGSHHSFGGDRGPERWAGGRGPDHHAPAVRFHRDGWSDRQMRRSDGGERRRGAVRVVPNHDRDRRGGGDVLRNSHGD